MIMPLEKPGTPEELIHFGVRGMKWGVRKEDSSSGLTSKEGMSTKKKVAIGVGTAAVVVGTVSAAYVLRKHGQTPTSVFKTARGKQRILRATIHTSRPSVQAKMRAQSIRLMEQQSQVQKQFYQRMDIASRRGVPLDKLIDAAQNPHKYKLNFNA